MVVFGGERFLGEVSEQAYITVKRTEQNSTLGLEVQLPIPEAVCPLSEPGLHPLKTLDIVKCYFGMENSEKSGSSVKCTNHYVLLFSPVLNEEFKPL